MTEIVTIAAWNPWPLVIPLLIVLAGAVAVAMGVRRRGSRLIELGVFVAIGGVLTGGLMTWGLSQAWDADAQRVALGELGYAELEITAGEDRAGAQPVLDFVGVVDGQHGERGKLRHVAGDQWEVVEF